MDFEAQREARIAANKAKLAALGLTENVVFITRKTTQPAKTKKRKPSPVEESEDNDNDEKPARKLQAVPAADDGAGPRRSGRHAGKKVDYSGDGDLLNKDSGPRILTEKARNAAEKEPMGVQNRTQNPKTFGAIPGVPVGTWWETRKECSIAAIHAPWVAGISGGPDGCYSVALSGGYEDDVDLGEGFTYTGSGGRDLKGTKQNPKNLRTAPQSSDQSFETKDNKALLKSLDTQKPIRVIRGYKLDSKYAPQEGYRYDGLYTVVKAWQEKGLNPKGYLVCKFALKRIEGQPPLPVYKDEEESTEDAPGEIAEESETEATQTAVASEPDEAAEEKVEEVKTTLEKVKVEDVHVEEAKAGDIKVEDMKTEDVQRGDL